MATKTVTVTFRMDPAVKESLQIAAQRELRSVANMIEVMILTYTMSTQDTRPTIAGHDLRRKIPLAGKTRKSP